MLHKSYLMAIHVASNSLTYLDRHVISAIFLFDCAQNLSFSTEIPEVHNIKLLGFPSCG